MVTSFSDGVIELLDFNSGQTLLSLPPSLVNTRSLALSEDAILTVSGLKGIRRFRLDPGLRSRTWNLPSGVTDLEFSPISDELVVAAGTTVVQLDWPTGEERERHRFASVLKSIGRTGGGILIAGTAQAEPGTAVAVYARTGPGDWRPYGPEPASYVRRMGVLGDAVIVGGWGASGPRYFPATEGETRWVIADPKSDAKCIANTPDAGRAVWGGTSGIWVMDASEQAPRLIEGVDDAYVISISVNGTLALVEREAETLLLDLETEEVRWRHPRGGAWPTSNAIDTLNRFTATGLQDGSVLIRDTESGSVRALLDAHDQTVGGIAFSTDGTTLVTGGWDDNLHLWDLSPLTEPLEAQLAAIDARWSTDSTTVLRELR